MKKILTAIFFCLGLIPLQAQHIEWTSSQALWYAGIFPLPAEKETVFLAKDDSGMIYSSGYYGYGAWGTHMDRYYNTGPFISKFDPSGNLLWGDTIHNGGYPAGFIYADNAIYICSSINTGGDKIINVGSYSFFKPDSIQITSIITKYSLTGQVIWARKILRSNSSDIKIFNNKLYLIGYAWKADFDGKYFENGYFLSEFDTSGVCNWINKVGDAELDQLTISDENNVYISTAYDQGYSIYKYNTNGDFKWKQKIPGISLTNITADKQGNCFLAIGFTGDFTIAGKTFHGIDGNYNTGNCIAKMDSTGNYTSAFQFGPNSGTNAMYYDNDTLFVGGAYWNNDFSGGGILYGEFKDDILLDTLKIPGYIAACILKSENSSYIGGYTTGQFHSSYLFKIERNTLTGLPMKTKEMELNIYPNPSGGLFKVKFESPFSDKLIMTIKNVLGQAVYNKTYESFNGSLNESIDLSKQPKGVYFIELIADKKRQVKKIVVD